MLSILALVFSWPDFGPYYEPGIDGSIVWVFNHLFDQGLEDARHIIFPHGPLAFLMYPVPFGLNLEIALIFHLVLAGLLSFNLFRLSDKSPIYFFSTPVILYLILVTANVQLLLLSVIVSAYLNSLAHDKIIWLICFIPLAVLAIFIKSYVGILAVLVTITVLIITGFRKASLWPLFAGFISIGLSLLVIWFLMYQDFNGLGMYFKGVYHLAGGNSNAVSYYPQNNWVYLCLFLLCLAAPVFIWRESRIILLYLLIFPMVFAAWKHGMSREDVFHAGQFLRLMLLLALISFVFLRKRRLPAVGIIALGIGFSYANFKSLDGFDQFRMDLWKAENFRNQVFNWSSYKSHYLKVSQERSHVNVLSDDVLEALQNGISDTYPWDYSVIPSNNVQWKPRPVLQSYAAYNSWLDMQNARYFGSEDRPDNLLWEKNKLIQSRYGEQMSSIDWRYLLNDEPETMLQIFNNYQTIGSRSVSRFEPLVSIPGSREIKRYVGEPERFKWDQWIPVPERSTAIQRVKLHINYSLWGQILNFLYKSGETYIYYQLEDLSILSYKIVPGNAIDGVWLNPFITSWQAQEFPSRVIAIKLKSSNPNHYREEIDLQFEDIEMPAPLLKHWGYQEGSDNREVFRKQADRFFTGQWEWNEGKVSQMQDPDQIESKTYYPILQKDFDSVLVRWNEDHLRIDFEARIKADKYGKAVAVLSIEKSGESLLWRQRRLSSFVVNEEEWSYFRTIWNISLDEIPEQAKGGKLKLMIWNPNEKLIEIRQVRTRMKY